MKLTTDNIAAWKQELDKKMLRRYGLDAYSDTISDNEWLWLYEGMETDEAIADEIDCWEL